MTVTAATLAALYKPCRNATCASPVHIQSKACKMCGAPSPWQATDAEPPATPVKEAAMPGRELITVQVLPPPAFEPHVVMADCKMMLGDVLGAFHRGQVLNDFQTILKLKSAGMPIVPASDAHAVVCCPRCHAVQGK
jgi:hypothetical protein